MKFSKFLSDFLYDKEYFITLYENKIHVYGYRELEFLSSKQILLKLENFKIKIQGLDLSIFQMNKEELIIRGSIESVMKIYE